MNGKEFFFKKIKSYFIAIQMNLRIGIHCNSNELCVTGHLVFSQLFTSVRDLKDCFIDRRYFFIINITHLVGECFLRNVT